ncbi:hypothetical protein NP233_g224 [Leucocoprinus birnbaumii]|uniref:Major facilitator superfamily (MFS) profile domain-containing protein n=1 Tax=Leucocoprinus birnbaumii TaxID=56174 RepID=A0AAD5Z0G6_9AGAR|nr:hypothetical protein NP233_g224 [Leucocoprinus birnbaumii]
MGGLESHVLSAPSLGTSSGANSTLTLNEPEHPVDGNRLASNNKDHKVQLSDQTNLLPTKKLIVCFLGLSLCSLISQLDQFVTATSLSSISADFDAGAISSWVPTAYLLTSTCVTPLYGRFSDIFGRKTMLLVALAVLVSGNISAGFADSIMEVIISRGVSGAGGGAIVTLAQIVMSDIVSLRERGKYQAISASVNLLGVGIGPVVGGAIAQNAGWRLILVKWCFWFICPIAFCAAAVVIFVLPLKPVQGNVKEKLLVIDFLGSTLTLVACTLILLPLIWGGVTFPWNSPVLIGTLMGGLATTGLFILWEMKYAKLPIVPMHIFKSSTVCGVYIGSVVTGMITLCTMNYLPQFFQTALGYSPIRSGVFLIPVLASQLVTNQVSIIILVGYAIWSIACGIFSTVTPKTPVGLLVFYMLLSGLGSGSTLQTATIAAQASVPRKDMATVTAFRGFLRLLGGALGLAIASAMINNSLRSEMQSLNISEATIRSVIDKPALLRSSPSALGFSNDLATAILYNGYIKGFGRMFIFSAGMSAAAFFTSIWLVKETNLDREDDEERKQEAAASAEDSEKPRDN